MTRSSISVYIHFPWCLRKCPYCDFHSLPAAENAIPHELYAKAVIQELNRRADQIAGCKLESVYIGGGTPSLWDVQALGSVLLAVLHRFAPLHDEVEVTVECNPSSLDRSKAAALAAIGVNRLSVGVQSLDAARLQFLGRIHDPAQALSALACAQAEVPRVSADLMFGLPGQTAASFAAELRRLVDLGLAHISAYALTIEPNTPFGSLLKEGRLHIASEAEFADSFEAAHQLLENASFEHYEVSNYAKSGQRSRHNMRYWRGQDYLGLGADAVGCFHQRARARRYRNHSDPLQYIRNSATASVEVFEETLGPQELVREAFMLGLRTVEGVNLTALEASAGVNPVAGRRGDIAQALRNRDLILEDGWLRVPFARWLFLDRIVSDIF